MNISDLLFYMFRCECMVSPARLPLLEPMRQVGTDPSKPVWAISHVLATAPDVCRSEAERSREALRRGIKMPVWC